MAEVRLVNVNKIYPHHVQAVYDFNLDIKDREFIVLVGPSGCGKSTTLRMIAGLEDISSGQLYIDGVLSNDIQPKDRGIAMVFQSYALYPHMTVRANMEFGLKMRDVDQKEIDRRVEEAARILDLTPYLERKPKELSGGQRQRVALGRAIVRQTKVFLMDEPLSNLDAKLRLQMRAELIALHEKIKATTIYVTHDQTEAMTMATRIVIMNNGRIQQIGTPKEVYNKPANMFVAGFIGSPAMNFLTVHFKEGEITLSDGQHFFIPAEIEEKMKAYEDKDLIMGIRPEDISISNDGIEEEITVAELLGSETVLHFEIGGEKISAKVSSRIGDFKPHDKVKFIFLHDRIHFFDPETKISIFNGALCLDNTLPTSFHGKKVACKGVEIFNKNTEKKKKIHAKADDIEMAIREGIKEINLPVEKMEKGKEFVIQNHDYRFYLSAKLVNKVLSYLAQSPEDSYIVKIY